MQNNQNEVRRLQKQFNEGMRDMREGNYSNSWREYLSLGVEMTKDELKQLGYDVELRDGYWYAVPMD